MEGGKNKKCDVMTHPVAAISASKALGALASAQIADAVARAVVEVVTAVGGDDFVGYAALAAQRWCNGHKLPHLGHPVHHA